MMLVNPYFNIQNDKTWTKGPKTQGSKKTWVQDPKGPKTQGYKKLKGPKNQGSKNPRVQTPKIQKPKGPNNPRKQKT